MHPTQQMSLPGQETSTFPKAKTKYKAASATNGKRNSSHSNYNDRNDCGAQKRKHK